MSADDRCDKCGTPMRLWNETPCVKSLTRSPRHTITRFYIPIPEPGEPKEKT